MLNLLKYEWKACARACLPVYAVSLLLAVVNRLIGTFHTDGFSGFTFYSVLVILAELLYFGVMVAVFIVTLVILIQRFHKNLLGDEGYLMFTLPVTPAQHIWTKAIIAFALCALSVVAAILSGSILTNGMSVASGLSKSLFNLLQYFARSPLLFLEELLLIILWGMAGILFCYLCMALGHLSRRHRSAMTFIWFVVLSTALQILLVLLAYIVGKVLVTLPFDLLPSAVQTHIVILGICAGGALLAAAFFAATHFILKNRLNLE